MNKMPGWRLFAIAYIFLSAMKVAAAAVSGQMSFQADTVHAEFEGRSTWDYQVRKSQESGRKFIELTVDALDAKSISQLEEFRSDLVRSVEVQPKSVDGRTLIKFEVANDGVEFFDYLTDQPSRLILDFYISEANRKKQETAQKASRVLKQNEKGKTADSAFEKDREPASDALSVSKQGVPSLLSPELKTGLFDGADPDFERFAIKDYEIKESSILRAKDNDYIPFPMLFTQNESFDQVKSAAPVYEIRPQAGSEETKMARLLLALFERGRDSVYLKTLPWFKEKFPDSKYNDLIAYMTGDVYLRKWQQTKFPDQYERAIQAYQDAVRKYPKAPAAERTSLMLGVLAMDRGDFISALRFFEAHPNNTEIDFATPFSRDLAKLGAGIVFMRLFKSADAIKTFDELEKSTTYPDLKADAAYRKGDVYSASKQHVKAIEEYQRAQRLYPAGRPSHPGSVFNQAEAMFWTGDYRASLNQFREFLKQYPNDGHGPYALTRVGELLDALGADSTRSMGAYLESFFRFGEDPKAIIARLRLLSTRMKGMKPKESELAVKEITSLAKKSDLPNLDQFATLLVADGYTSRGEYPHAIDLLTTYYQQNPTAPGLASVRKRIVSNIAEKLHGEVAAGNFIQALKTHQQYADSWLKGTERLDVQSSLAKSFEMAGAPKEAFRLYQNVLNQVHAAKGTPREKSLKILAGLPSEESLNLRIAKVASGMKNYQKAYDHLRLIKNPELMSENEQIERIELAVNLLENRGDLPSAIRYLNELLKSWKGQPQLVALPYLELARLEKRMGSSKDAVESLKKISALMKDSEGKVPEAIHASSLEELGHIQYEMGQRDDAVATYQALLDAYEKKRPLASIRYRLGQIQFDQGEIKKAAVTWSDFKGEKTEFWKNLAQEQLKNSEWRDEYKRYIQRIPAMEKRE